ncbi:hypothetical protein P3X46_003044 [Hevea brasiliensis]|uniref:RRM domain-containing protein n=2 Tax=Hevea brasiliensis TaxID=3981 RepID=A0ABQ9N9V4_HEVBR|nr:hypothetical protein P3X46_003044 [Hevea brasiliensis]
MSQMMMVGNPTSLLTSPNASTANFICFCIQMPNETQKTMPHLSYFSSSSSTASSRFLPFKNSCFLSSPLLSQRTHFSFCSLLGKRDDILCGNEIKKQRKGGTALMEMSDLDGVDEMDDELDDFDDENEDVEDEEMFLPFGKMKKWLENKPRGFGEGKVYDTSIEDKMLEEMERSRKAQAANINKLKNNPINSSPKKDNQNKKVTDVVPSGFRVHVVNLPKKKNILRDLKSAFKEVPGVINMIPAVSGNKKTKDPICKGFAFVDFNSEEDAIRFVQQFSGQNVAFGRIQKQIKCVMTNSHSSISSDDESADSSYSGSNLMVPAPEEDKSSHIDMDDSSFEETSPEDGFVTEKLQDVVDNLESFSISELDSNDNMESMTEPTPSSFSLKKQNKSKATKKKTIVKGRREKVPKMEIPGSGKKLKIKEKAVLTNVFSKYGLHSSLASKEDS